jgi:hypothetical protein
MQSLGWWYLMAPEEEEPEHLDPRFPYDKLVRWRGDGSLAEFMGSYARGRVRVMRDEQNRQ